LGRRSSALTHLEEEAGEEASLIPVLAAELALAVLTAPLSNDGSGR
jgi:hypothetical protein